MKLIGFCAALIAALLVVVVTQVDGSGTYRPPRPPKGAKFDASSIRAGKKLFESSEWLGKSANSCASCHAKKAKSPLRRSALKKRGAGLFQAVQKCGSHPERGAGKKVQSGTKQSYDLGAYIVSRYRLPIDQFDGFTAKSAGEAAPGSGSSKSDEK